jgi:hypothetical protein
MIYAQVFETLVNRCDPIFLDRLPERTRSSDSVLES